MLYGTLQINIQKDIHCIAQVLDLGLNVGHRKRQLYSFIKCDGIEISLHERHQKLHAVDEHRIVFSRNAYFVGWWLVDSPKRMWQNLPTFYLKEEGFVYDVEVAGSHQLEGV